MLSVGWGDEGGEVSDEGVVICTQEVGEVVCEGGFNQWWKVVWVWAEVGLYDAGVGVVSVECGDA